MEEMIIEAGRARRHYWRDLWHYRELFYFLAWRDLLVRYKQTVVGVGWALIRPCLTMIILTFVFGVLARVPSPDAPYPILALCGMLPWQFFATALSESGNSLVGNSSLISKVYFPRLVVPAGSVITSFVDFLISAALLVALLVWYQFMPTARIVYLPLFIVMAFGASFGAGLWIAALMVQYRDFRIIVPFVVQFGLYLSPVAYPAGMVSEKFGEGWRMLYSLNPVVGVIDGFRWAIIGGSNELIVPNLLISLAMVCLLLVTGVWYFRRTERIFADVI